MKIYLSVSNKEVTAKGSDAYTLHNFKSGFLLIRELQIFSSPAIFFAWKNAMWPKLDKLMAVGTVFHQHNL